jgi:hypothetical protein
MIDYADVVFDDRLKRPGSTSILGSTTEFFHMMDMDGPSSPPFAFAANMPDHDPEVPQFYNQPPPLWSLSVDTEGQMMASLDEYVWTSPSIPDVESFSADEYVDEKSTFVVQQASENNHVDGSGSYSLTPTEAHHVAGIFSSRSATPTIDVLGTPSILPVQPPHYQFSQGQRLLQTFGYSDNVGLAHRRVSQAELDVAANLRGHWYPVRP